MRIAPTMEGNQLMRQAKKKETQGDRKKRRNICVLEVKEPKGDIGMFSTPVGVSGGHINTLQTWVPEDLNAVTEDGWEKVEVAVDSGATETVLPEEQVLSVPVEEGEASRRGVEYEVAKTEFAFRTWARSAPPVTPLKESHE